MTSALDDGRAAAGDLWQRPSVVMLAGAALALALLVWVAGEQAGVVLWALVREAPLLLVWLVACAGYGRWTLRGLGERGRGRLAAVSAVGIGLGAMSLLTLGLGVAGWLDRAVAAALVGLGAAGWVADRALARGEARGDDGARGGAWLWLPALAGAPVIAIVAAAAVVPPGVLWGDEPHGYDVVSYHLQLPREWHDRGAVAPTPHNVFGFFPLAMEMHFLLAMHLRGGAYAGMFLAQLMHAACTLLTAAAVHAAVAETGRPSASRRGGAAVAAAATLVTPWVGLLAPVAYNDGLAMLLGALAIAWFLRAIDEERPARPLALAGLLAGFACAAKLTAGPMLLTPIVALAAVTGSAAPRRRVAGALVALAAGAAALAPWLARNVAWTGNPLFPQATALFGSAHWRPQQVERWQAAHAPRDDQRGALARTQALARQVLVDWRYGYVLLPAALLAAVARRTRRGALLVALLAWMALFWLAFTHLQSRFLVLAIAPAAMLWGELPRRLLPVAGACALAGAALASAALGARLDSRLILPGQTDLRVIMEELLGRPLAETVAEGASPVALIGDARAFWYPIDSSRLIYRTVFDVEPTARDALGAYGATPPDAVLIVDPNELRRLHATYRHVPPPPADARRADRPFAVVPASRE